jgi:MFS family permease
LAAVLFINYVDRGTLPTAAHLMQGDLHLNDAQMGTLLSAFFWTYAFVQIPVGWLAERYGAHRILAAGLTLWALATMLVGAAHTFTGLLVLRLMLGLGESAGFPCVSKLLALVVPVKGLGTANGIVGFAYLFGPAVGTYFGARLMAQFGWRSAFLVFGALSLLWLWPWSRVAGQVHATRSSTDKDSPTLWMILKHPALWGTGLGLFSSNYTFYFMLSWLPSYLVRERGFSMTQMAQLAGGAYLVNALFALGTGWAIDRVIRRGGSPNVAYKSVMAVAHIGSVVCMLCMATGSRPLALGSIFIYQALCGASSPGVYAICQILAGARASGRWVGIQNSLGNLAGIVAPWLTGLIIYSTGHFTAAFVVAAAVSMLGLVGWIWMLPKLAELRWKTATAPAAALDAPG